MASSTSQATAIGGTGEERNEEAASASEGGNGGSQLVMPKDGYEWRKYGQKFIKSIQKNRSYFRCRHRLCGAKKKVEWHPQDPSGYLRIVYEGAHQHGSDDPPSSAQGTGAAAVAAAAALTIKSWALSTSARGFPRID